MWVHECVFIDLGIYGITLYYYIINDVIEIVKPKLSKLPYY